MQNNYSEGLKIHTGIRPELQSVPQATPEKPKRRRWKARRAPAVNRRAKRRPDLGERLLRNTAVACALLLGVLTLQNVDQPWSRLALSGVESALTMKIDLDESLGKLSFVRDLVPESALVFLNVSVQQAFAPVDGTLSHGYSEAQPWIAYRCEPQAEVRALEPATVSAVTQLSGGDWGLLLDHGAGIESVYAYLGEVLVRAGDAVSAGEILGRASEGPETNIYFELRKDGRAIDPAERLER